MATGSGMRIGDADREATAQSLRENFAHGRLTMEEFQERLDAAFAAKTDVDLAKLTDDLPHSDPYAAPWPPSQPAGSTAPGLTGAFGNGQRSVPGGDWPGQGGTPRRFALAGVSVAMLVLLLVAITALPIWGVPKVILIVFAVFTMVSR